MNEKGLKKWLESDYRNENMILSGLRYSLSRYTYQCSDGCDVFQTLLPMLSNRVLEVAYRDCEHEINMRTRAPTSAMEMCDVTYIQELMKAVQKEMEHRKERVHDKA